MVLVLFLAFIIDQDVIKVVNHKPTNVSPKHFVHEPYKGTRGIYHTKWHHKPLVQDSFCLKCCLPFISLPNSNLIVPLLKSTLENTFESYSSSNISYSLSMGCLYLMVMLFIARLSTHIHMLQAFFGTKRVGIVHGLELSLTNPLDTNSSTCLWASVVSLGFIL